MTVVALKAFDTLFFRDGKPFSMGEETWATGLFPPPLSVVYGALRTSYFSEHIGELKKANREDDPTLSLRINFSAYHGGGKYFYPCPLDIVQKKEKKGEPEYSLLELVERQADCCSSLQGVELPMLLQSQQQVEVASGLIDEISLNEYLQNSLVPPALLNMDNYLREEPKVGISRNNLTGSADEGMLYRVGMKRMLELNLAVGYSGLNITGRLMRLGGEGKSVSVSELNENQNVQGMSVLHKKDEFFKLYLATPAIFNEGWRPAPDKIPGAKLVAAVIGKPLYIGGFDMKPKNGQRPHPKPMRRAVPAGSIYYYQGIAEVQGDSISDYGYKQGYGIYYIGKVSKGF
jgi:CRISPR-associated protein Cmr3